MRKKDLVPLLVPLLPCWSVVIAAYETGVFTKIVLMDQRWLQWVNKLLSALKAGNLKEKIWFFDNLAAAKLFKTATDALALRGMTMYSTRHSGASFD